jgi:hypothetical protein
VYVENVIHDDYSLAGGPVAGIASIRCGHIQRTRIICPSP